MKYKVSKFTADIREVKDANRTAFMPDSYEFFDTREEAVKWVHRNLNLRLENAQQEANKAKKRLIAFMKRENIDRSQT